jgi:hypothetical protein
MRDAGLHPGLRKHSVDRAGEAVRPVTTAMQLLTRNRGVNKRSRSRSTWFSTCLFGSQNLCNTSHEALSSRQIAYL